jgi:purine-binding chemotaxis protein CheW
MARLLHPFWKILYINPFWLKNENHYPAKSTEWPMQGLRQLLVFVLDERRFCIDLSIVLRVARMVEITPLPRAPDVVLGLINVQGQVVPVVTVRKPCGLPDRPPQLHDRLILMRLPARVVALVVDEVIGIVHRGEQEVVTAQALFPGIESVDGVVKCDDDLVLIQNIEQFFHRNDEQELTEAIKDLGQVQ